MKDGLAEALELQQVVNDGCEARRLELHLLFLHFDKGFILF
jgi:hypothetical protein